MTKAKLKKLMKTYCIMPSELDDVFSFVADLLYIRAKEIEKTEPYAYRTIDSIMSAEREVDDLINYVSELEEEDESDNT